MLCCMISISFVSQRLGKLSPFRELYLIWFVCLGFSTCHILGAGTLALAAWSWIWRFKDALLSNVEYQYSLVQWHLNNKTSGSVGLQVILVARWSPYQGEIQRKSKHCFGPVVTFVSPTMATASFGTNKTTQVRVLMYTESCRHTFMPPQNTAFEKKIARKWFIDF